MKEHFYSKKNYIGLLIGSLLLVLSFFFLSRPPVDGVLTLSVAPVLLTLTYCIIFPVALLLRGKKQED
jgi:protein-S-isoprenylcysteine O-methyltransferase Ste14